MKTILTTFLLLFSIVILAQDPPEPYSDDYDKPGNGNCNGHYPGDGHPSWHPCHDGPAVPIDSKPFIIASIGLGLLFAFYQFKKKSYESR